ncbi:early nodulin-like protein 20 [Cornus florida]|uniref:early nodulin-like protein 20 n=1 Tax=Cornus florida TaxID=4283 RepID=UPI00289F38B4|nr:early nodulin-like protein 20 [Cornus florida]
MEGLRRVGLVSLIMMAGMLTCAVCRSPVLHKVGGKQGWTPNINYTNWSIQERFYVGDWLYFGFDKHYYNVLEVNKTCYEQCNDRNFIKNITRGGRDVFNLTEARPFYFLSSGGYCYHGMKLAVNVVEFVPSPVPSPAEDDSSTNTGSRITLLNIHAVASILAILFQLF